MSAPSAVEPLRERFFHILLGAARPCQDGPDTEVALEALIAAAEMLRERFEQELTELRLEAAE